jgi:hypothetical protein
MCGNAGERFSASERLARWRHVADALDIGGVRIAARSAAGRAPSVAQCQLHHVVTDLLLQHVDRLVVGDDALGGLVVAALHDVGAAQLRRGHLAHAQVSFSRRRCSSS